MKNLQLFLVTVLAGCLSLSCSAQPNKENGNSGISVPNTVEVFYFHYTHRCATCNAVENVSREAVQTWFEGKVDFVSYNLEEKNGKAKAEELGVSGQSLLIVSGDTQINLTNEGFMNARTHPDKLKAILKEKIDSLL